MNESEKQFSVTRAAPSTSGRAQNQILISSNMRGIHYGNLFKMRFPVG
jgi:hypothetical protein